MKTRSFLFTAGLALAVASILSCSSPEDGDDFETITIGDQTWMAENLNLNVAGSKCYRNLESNCNAYGRLYNWSTAMGFYSSCNFVACSSQIQSPHRGICPAGWHIPSNADWDKLYRCVDGNSEAHSPYHSLTAGTKLKATSGWNDYEGASGNGTDDYGFSALPGNGYSYREEGFYIAGSHGIWWSSTEDEDRSNYAYLRYMAHNDEYGSWSIYDKSDMYSVRCVKD